MEGLFGPKGGARQAMTAQTPPGPLMRVAAGASGFNAKRHLHFPAARVVELHTHIREGDVMRMRPVADIPLPSGQTVHLRPGGLHIMLIGLTEPLRQGATVPLTLRFERAGEVQVTLGVESAGARGHAH